MKQFRFLYSLLKMSVIFFALYFANSKTFGQSFNMEGTTVVSGSGYDLTPLTGGSCFDQLGALWCTTTLDFTQPFRLDFQAKFKITDGSGADGICVVFGQMGTTAAPVGIGGGLGYYAGTSTVFSSNSFAVELDIYNNGPGADDIAADHTTVTKDGLISSPVEAGAAPIQLDPAAASVKDNTFRNYTVIWSPATHSLLIYCNCHLRIISHYDYASLFTTPTTINWGFTASTGGYCASQIVQSISTSIPSVDTASLAQCGGSVTLNASGTGPEYYWFPTSATTSSITVSSSGTYSALSYDTASCTTATKTYYVTINPIPNISGPDTVCLGSTINLVADVGGGSWTSGTTAVATVGALTGIVRGVSVGNAVITYTTLAGCTGMDTITVAPLPDTILGNSNVCVGSMDTLTDTTVGGTWRSSNTSIATVGMYTGIVTGVSTGTVTITYILSTGCYKTRTLTVNPLPTISGTLNVCVGSTTTLSATPAGGHWHSGNTAIATVGAGTGIVTGVATGTVTISYTSLAGCLDTVLVNVYPLPTISPDTLTVCVGATITVGGSPAGALGIWSETNSHATLPGYSTGVSIGVDTFIYTYGYAPGASCATSKTITVNPTPSISDTSNMVCIGSTIAYHGSISGGTWSSSDTTIATVGTSTGVITGIRYGVAIITYTLPTGCFDTASVFVTKPPTAIHGYTPLCVGSTAFFTDTIPRGTWSSSDTTKLTVSSAGLVTAVNYGTATITYSNRCGYATFKVTVNPSPVFTSPPTATSAAICFGALDTLSATAICPTGGSISYAWSPCGCTCPGCSTTIITSIIDPLGPNIYYVTATDVFGCTTTSLVVVTVNPVPDAITGRQTLCVGTTDTLRDDTTGGTWSSKNTSIATIGGSTGIVTGVSSGVDTIGYRLSDGCFVTFVITVNPSPKSITGKKKVCVGATTALSDTTTSGTWSSGNTAIATVGASTGIVTGVATGTVEITYMLAGGCISTTLVTVNPSPSVISGSMHVCIGLTDTLTDAVTGGTWFSHNTSIATIGATTGVVTGVSPGIDTISYGLSDSCSVSTVITVNPLPVAISGPDTVCVGASITLSDLTTGGTFSGGPSTIATVSVTGLVTGISVGTAIDTYTIGSTGCFVTDTVTVITVPTVPPITGYDSICIGGTTTYSDTDPGGLWTSVTTAIATVTSGGVVTGVSFGTDTIKYTVTNSCGPTTVYRLVHVIGIPATPPPIMGAPGVCAGLTDTLTDAIPGGTWTSGNPFIATVGFTSGIVTGVATGLVEITYTVHDTCGTASVYKTISVNMPAYITTNTLLACHSYGDYHFGEGYTLPDTGCHLVCDSTIVRYYANGVAGSTFTWSVWGGIIITNYGDSIDVLWPTVGTTGTITLYDTAGGCTSFATGCIQVIAKPHADFSASAISICLGGSVVFTDLSTADPLSTIVSWRWDFGDGGYSSVENPTHEYTAGGTYTVSLVVKNECGCTDTFRQVITVSPYAGPVIACPSAVCDSEVAVYTTSGGCGAYDWSVLGGTIVSGLGTSSLTVKWDHAGPDGFGYVYLSEPCGMSSCPDTAAIQIPVILQNAVIDGPDTLCAGHPYSYSLPLWPGTQYMWGVIDSPGDVRSNPDDYKVLVAFTTPGTYTIHGWYQNRLKLCGGNVYKTVTVVPATDITGPTTVCEDVVDTFRLTDTASASWTLSRLIPDTVIATGSGTAFTYLFAQAGMYLLTASGSFCANPFTITVLAPPDTNITVSGADTVCLGRPYMYTAHYGHRPPGAVLTWAVAGGTVTPTSGSDTVSVTWAGGAMQLSAYWVSTSAPYCAGPLHTLNVTQEVINPDVTGDTLPCANARRTYNANYTRGEVYDWTIIPATAGSVIAGAHDTAMTVLWNNVTSVTPAFVAIKVSKCDSTITDTLEVNIQPTPPPAITASADSICPSDTVTFAATAGDSVYVWNFGDGSPSVTGSDTIRHLFPLNTTTGNIVYTVKVTSIPSDTVLCPMAGTSIVNITVYPGPVAYASAGGTLCPTDSTEDSVMLYGTVTGNVTGLSYQWFIGSPPFGDTIAGATDTSLLVRIDTAFYFTVTASNGCSAVSNAASITISCPGGGGCYPPTPVSTSVSCHTIHLNGVSGSSSPQWYDESSGHYVPPGVNVDVYYDTPGIYVFQFTGGGACPDPFNNFDTIGYVPEFTYRLKCGTGGNDTIVLADHTPYLPFFTIDSVVWYDAGGRLGAGSTLTVTHAGSSTYTVTEKVSATDPHGTTTTCDTSIAIHLPAPPFVSFTDTLSPICEDVPVRFTSTVLGGILSYDWDFGDSSSSILPDPERTFIWKLPANPMLDTVTLTVMDSIGCVSDTTKVLQIYHNDLTGIVALVNPIIQCSTSLPVTLTYTPTGGSRTPISYLWSNSGTTSSITVNTTGSYWVTVIDTYQCRQTVPTSPFPAEQVYILQTPTGARITGQWNYCIGDAVTLSGYNGRGMTYEWLRDGSVISSDSAIIDRGLPVGSYSYSLVVSITDMGVTCSDTAVLDSVHMYGLPSPPTITGPTVIDCGSYQLQLSASEPMDGLYDWSDGNHGATDTIYTGGPYRVWFTDLFGCTNFRDTTVPYSPDTYFPYFPSGCYTLCTQQLPLTLYGAPYSFISWAWLMDGSVASSGTGFMGSYVVDTDGTYQWSLGNGLCSQTSDPLTVTTINCNKCNDTSMSVTITCDTANPASYGITVTFTSPDSGTVYTIGTDIGPIDPFSGTLSTAGSTTLTLTFTTLYPMPLPDSVTVEIALTLPDGTKCFLKQRVPLPSCTWVAERPSHTGDTSGTTAQAGQILIANSLLVYPNPSTGNVTVSYDYGTADYGTRSLHIYSAIGSEVASTQVQDVHGSWNVNATNWTSGVYIIRMDADGKTLQTQRMVIVSK